MWSRRLLVAMAIVISAVPTFSACSKAQQPPPPRKGAPTPAKQPAVGPVISPQERQLYLDAARTSWDLVNRITEPATGLARAHPNYSYVTLWDVAGVIAANHVARELNFINDVTFDAHIGRILSTLSSVDLFDRRAFNRIYDAKTGRM